jgi:hypothetical protein
MNPHLTEDQIAQWIAEGCIAGDRSREAEQHLLACPDCAAQVAGTQRSLLLFRDSGYQSAEYWQKQPKTPTSRSPVRWAAVAAIMATATILAVVFVHRPPVPQSRPLQEVFLRVPYVVPPAPYERTEVVRMDVPVAALIAAGFKMNTPAADSVSADILLGQDGRPLAVGFPENNQ